MSDFVIKNGMLTEYNGPGGDVVIPEGVTAIGNGAFRHSWSLTSVAIPDSVTAIEKHAFEGCESLTSVTIPDRVTTIGYAAFSGCKSLTSVTIPDSVTKVGDIAFGFCSNLTNITFGSGVTTIVKDAFYHCEKIAKIVMPVSTGSFVSKLFEFGNELRIDIPDISALPAKFRICAAWCYAEDGGEVTDPRYESHMKYLKANAGKIVETAVQNTPLLALLCREGYIKAKDIEAYVDAVQKTGDAEKIAMVLDYQNSKLTKKQKENVVKQKEKAENTVFDRAIARMNQVGIAGLNFVITGKLDTFENRNELKSFIESQGGKLQSSMSAKTDYLIMNDAESDTEKKKKAEALGIDVITELQFNDKSGWAFVIKDGALTKYRGAGGDVVIPDSVTTISGYAFDDCKSLTSVTIPDSVTSIGKWAFRDCQNLTSITIPDSVTSIHYREFGQCKNLTIHGKAGSYAETYAKEKNIPFVADAV